MIVAVNPNLGLALPEIVMAIGAIKMLIIGLFRKNNNLNWCFYSALFFVVAAIMVIQDQTLETQVTFNGLFIKDSFTNLFKTTILGAGAFCLIFTRTTTSIENIRQFEYPILMMFSLLGMMVTVSSHDFLSLFIGVELQSLSTYIMVAMRRPSLESGEAALKYFVLGALATGIMLYGLSLIYGFTGTTSFELLEQFLKTNMGKAPSIHVLNKLFNSTENLSAIIGVLLIVASLGFKVAAAPFHSWAPDVYQGTPNSLTIFIATAPKIAALTIIVKILFFPLIGAAHVWKPLVFCLAVLSMFVGSITALLQVNIRRLMAYSSIGNMGFALVGVATGTREGAQATLVYGIVYVAAVLLFFSVSLLMLRRGQPVNTIDDLNGAHKKFPTCSILLAVSVVSMAGIPPFPGFFPKLYVLKSGLQTGHYIICVMAVLYSVIAAAYYLRILKAIFFESAEKKSQFTTGHVQKNARGEIDVFIAIASLVIFLGLFVVDHSLLLDACQNAVMAIVY